MVVSTIVQPLTPLSTVEIIPLGSKEAIWWATFASAVGDTKLPLTAMVKNPGGHAEGKSERTSATSEGGGRV
jgi:hypothetical protein